MKPLNVLNTLPLFFLLPPPDAPFQPLWLSNPACSNSLGICLTVLLNSSDLAPVVQSTWEETSPLLAQSKFGGGHSCLGAR